MKKRITTIAVAIKEDPSVYTYDAVRTALRPWQELYDEPLPSEPGVVWMDLTDDPEPEFDLFAVKHIYMAKDATGKILGPWNEAIHNTDDHEVVEVAAKDFYPTRKDWALSIEEGHCHSRGDRYGFYTKLSVKFTLCNIDAIPHDYYLISKSGEESTSMVKRDIDCTALKEYTAIVYKDDWMDVTGDMYNSMPKHHLPQNSPVIVARRKEIFDKIPDDYRIVVVSCWIGK